MELSVRRITEETDLERITDWMYEWWGREHGYLREAVHCCMAHSLNADRLPQTYGLYRDGELIGMYQLTREDLFCRPDLCPWLANVYVDPACRGEGCGARLLASVRESAAALGAKELYLYTAHVGLYEKFGWEFMGEIDTFQRLYRLRLAQDGPRPARAANIER